jgi:hypothetical protein
MSKEHATIQHELRQKYADKQDSFLSTSWISFYKTRLDITSTGGESFKHGHEPLNL